MARPPPSANPPDEAALREAALNHLARYATTEARLRQVLTLRLDRWARAATERPETIAEARAHALPAIARVVAALAAAGALDDAAFAANRARTLRRAGKSGRAIAQHLMARGVATALAQQTIPEDPEAERGAALLLARRRKLGPFRASPASPETVTRERAILARAGFSEATARAALRLDTATAEAWVARLRRE